MYTPLQDLLRHAAIAARPRLREGVEVRVGLVDDHRPGGAQRGHVVTERVGSGDRLLEEQDRCDEPRELRRGGQRSPELEHAVDRLVLLVAVEGDHVGARPAIEHCGDRLQTRDVGRHVTADLQLEVRVPIRRHHVFEGLGQSIVDPASGALIGGGDGIDETHRVSSVETVGVPEAGEERIKSEARELR